MRSKRALEANQKSMAHPAAQRSAKYTIKDFGYNKLERAVWERKNLGPLGSRNGRIQQAEQTGSPGQRSFWADNEQTGMYGPPLCRKRKMRVTGWSAQMYSAFIGAQGSWP